MNPRNKTEALRLISEGKIPSKEAAKCLSVSYGTIKRWVRKGETKCDCKRLSYIILRLESKLMKVTRGRDILK